MSELATYARMTLVAVGLGIAWLMVTTPDADPEPRPLPQCVAEYQVTDCRWDAELHGNGTGQSFTVRDGKAIFDHEKRA